MMRDYSYADLSARLFKVNFFLSEFKEDARLKIKLGPSSLNLDYLTAMAFGLKDGDLTYLGHSADLTIEDLKGLYDNGTRSLLLLVINCGNEPPFNESLNITMDTRLVIPPKDFNWAIFKIKARTNYNYNDGSSTVGSYIYADGDKRVGDVSDHIFNASWSEPYSSGTSAGTLDIEFDPERYPRFITSYQLSDTRILSDTKTYTISGENLELWGYDDGSGTWTYRVSREETGDFITSLGLELVGQGGYGYTTDGLPITDESAYIEIRMGREELP
jgi:hypothetical protein